TRHRPRDDLPQGQEVRLADGEVIFLNNLVVFFLIGDSHEHLFPYLWPLRTCRLCHRKRRHVQKTATHPKSPNGRHRYPHISRRKDIHGGKPSVRDMNLSVRAIVIYVLRLGMTAEELAQSFPGLTLSQIHSALSYYYDHKQQIDKEIEQNTEEYWEKKTWGETRCK
ncbi:DUF433 domain-containing protein, partial [Cytophagia bacterium CHB2]|nr:DUF433 domain-containing protein [Cytophagia bacterium CHB2]